MNLTVFTGPDTAANIDELFRRTPLGRSPVCAVVPDNRSVTAMQKRLAAQSGDAFLGHRIFTIEGLAMEILSLSGNRPEIIKGHVKRAIIAEIVKSRIGEQSKFSTISSYPGFVSLLETFLEDIRSRGDGRVSREPELGAIVSAYKSHLARLGYNDHEGIITCELEGDRIERFAGFFHGPLIVDGFYDLTERQFELVERLVGCFSRSAVTLVNDTLRSSLFGLSAHLLSRFQSLGARVVDVITKPSSTPGKVLRIFMGDGFPTAGDPEDIQIHTFRSETAEADWIAGTVRTMLCNGICEAGEILIVSRYQRNFGSQIERALRLHGIPVQGGFARPFITHPVVRLALNALEASIHPENEELISSVQMSSFTGNRSSGNGNPLEGIDERGWSCRIAEFDSPGEYAVSFRDMLDDLSVKENLDGGGLQEFALSESAAFEQLDELLSDFVRIYKPLRIQMKADEFNSLLRRFLGDVRIPDRPSPAGGVLVVDVNHARYISRDVVFLTGLDDVSFPARDTGYFLHDDDIAQKLRNRHRAEEPLLFYMAAHDARKLFLTFPGIDDEGCDHTMSPYLREIRDSIDSWSATHFHYGVPGAACEDGAPDRRGRSEQLVRELKKDYLKAPSILSSIGVLDKPLKESIKSAVKALIKRVEIRGVDLSAHPSFDVVRSEWETGRIFSITGLETYLSCPVKYFLLRLLGLSVETRIPGEIDPATRGQLVHKILAIFYTERRKHGGNTGFTRHELPECKALMKEIVDEVFAKTVHFIGGVHTVTFIAERKFLHSWMETFLEREAEYFKGSNFQPAAFEIEFGRVTEGREAEYDALELESGDGHIFVRGRIDRIDEEITDGNRTIRIIDYKTGDVNTSIKDLSEGLALQIPLYLDAARKAIYPGSSIYDGVFYNLREMEFREYKIKGHPVTGADWDGFIDETRSRAVSAASDIRRGYFPPPEKECEKYCEFLPLCRGGVKR